MDDPRKTLSPTAPMSGRSAEASPPSLHKLINLSRPHHLLDLVGKAVGAAHGAIGLVSPEGDLQEHVTFGMDEDQVRELRRSPWGGELIRFVLHYTAPIRVSDFSRDLPSY